MTAGFATLLFLTARLILPLGWSFLVTVVLALGTQAYSSASRNLGADTWGILLVAGAIFLLLRAASSTKPLDGYVLGTLAAWAYIVRPTNSLPLIALVIYLAIWNGRTLWRFLAAVGVWLGALVTYSMVHFGRVLPDYFLLRRLGGGPFGTFLAGHLVSPSRGLLVFVPVVGLAVGLAIRYRRHIRFPRLALLAGALMTAHLLVVAYYSSWGGHSFGPRLLTGMVPWLALLAILSVDAARSAARSAPRSWMRRGGGSWSAR